MTDDPRRSRGLECCRECGRTYNQSICRRGCPACQDYSEVLAR